MITLHFRYHIARHRSWRLRNTGAVCGNQWVFSKKVPIVTAYSRILHIFYIKSVTLFSIREL